MLNKRKQGFVLIEALLGLALFAIYIAAFFPIVIGVREVPFFAGNRDRAILICEEGLEAVRNIKEADFANLVNGTHGLAITSNEWALSGTFDNVGNFTREITIASVNDDTKSVACDVTWNQTEARSATIELVTYFTNWAADGFVGDCDWGTISVPAGGTYDYTGNDDAQKVMAQGDYAYVVIDYGGSYDFAIHDVSDPENITLEGSLAIATNSNEELTNIFVRGDYAYISSEDDDAELIIVDISNPAVPVVASSFSASGGADAMGVYVIGDTAYLSRVGSNSSNELITIDVSTAISPSQLGSADIGGNGSGGNEIFVMNNHAFISSEDNTTQLKIVDVSDSNNPNYLATSGYSLSQSSNQSAVGIWGFENTILLGGSDGYLYLIDVTDPTDIDQTSEISNFDIGDTVHDINVAAYNGTENGVVLAVSAQNVNDEFQIVDITTPGVPVALSSYEFSADMLGVDFNGTTCALYVVGGPNSDPEFNILLAGDQVAPAAITDLATSAATSTTIDLDWTAPGDDGALGTATTYDIRYATTTITEGNWASATQVVGEPTPSIAGTAETMTVSGLDTNTTYYFAMKTSDEVPNESDLSNVATGTTAGVTPTNIFVETFPNADGAWNGSSDTSQDMANWYVIQGSGDTNDVQVSNEDVGSSPSGGNHLTFEDCDQGFQTPEAYDMAYAEIDLSSYTSVTIEYYWQSDDVDANEGLRVAYSTNTTNGVDGTWTQIDEFIDPTDDVWTQEQFSLPDVDATSSFVLRFSSRSTATGEHIYIDDIRLTGIYTPDVTAPDNITDLAASNPDDDSIELSWTAPGDDGSTGTATTYDIRYSTSTITTGNWASATPVVGEPTPSSAGSSESMIVSGLDPSTTYYFAMKTSDEVPNESGLSNVASETTTAPPVCDIDVNGTYIEAENFVSTISQGTATFIEQTTVGGYNGDGYLFSNGGNTNNPPTEEGKEYYVNFPETGTYYIWMRGYATGGSDNSLWFGLNGTETGALVETSYSTWQWTNTLQAGTGANTISVTSTGQNIINAWVREPDHEFDGFYITKGTETPSGGIPVGATILDPTACTWEIPEVIFEETFPTADAAWNGTSDTAQDEEVWGVYQGSSDADDVQVSNEDVGTSPSGGTHLTFEDCDDGFNTPENYDNVYIPVNLAGYKDVEIEYYWQSDDVDAGEGMRVAYSTNSTDGRDGTWTQIAEYVNPADDTWTLETYNLADVDAVSGFMLRFSSYSNRANEHMYVDDIKITATPDLAYAPQRMNNVFVKLYDRIFKKF